MIEKFPKIPHEDNSEEDSDEETAAAIAEATQMTMEDKVDYVNEVTSSAPERVRIVQERLAHLNAQIEHMKEKMKTGTDRDREIVGHDLAIAEGEKDGYLKELENIDENLKLADDFRGRTLN